MIYSISDQFSELKMILHPSSSQNSASGLISRGYPDDATSASADATSTNSDFTFPVPGSAPAQFSSPDPRAFQLIVQDLAAGEISDIQELFCKPVAFHELEPLPLDAKLLNTLRFMAPNFIFLLFQLKSSLKKDTSPPPPPVPHNTILNSSVNSEVEGRLQKSLNEKKEYQDLLITCITLHLDFFEERSGRSCTICKCPMQKLSTEVERPTIREPLKELNLSPIDGDSAGVPDTLIPGFEIIQTRNLECSLATCQEPCHLSEHAESNHFGTLFSIQYEGQF
ncbi:hypothetical protein FXO38_25201 [Capsicum annuum]|nr:hypothetical protein FXO38_25201 [Capsicum annuum]